MAFTYRVGDRSVDVRLQGRGADRVLIVEDRTVSFRVLRQDRDELVLELDGRVERLVAARTAAGIEVAWRGRTYRLATADQDAGPGAGSSVGGGDGRIRTPMPGKIVAVHVAEGDAVEAGQPLLVLESMKMQNDVVSDVTGTVTRILRELGTNVEFGDVLVEVTPAPSEDG